MHLVLKMSRKNVALSLSDKVKVIELHQKKKRSVREIMLQFSCGKTQIYETLKNKERIMSEWLGGSNGEMKRKQKATGYEKINEVLWEWFVTARSKNYLFLDLFYKAKL